MKCKNFLFSLIVFFCMFPANSLIAMEQSESAKAKDRASYEKFAVKLRKYLITQHVNGSVAVVKRGTIIYNEGLGTADIRTGALNEAETTYPIASITKLIVATSILQLQEKGKLRITDPVSKYIPNFSDGKEIRLIHLLNQTSGINPPSWHAEDTNPIDIINRIEQKPRKFPAGSRWDYNDINYIVLGYIVEKVSGTSLHDYIQKNILDKAGMEQTGFITEQQPKSYTSVGHHRIDNQLVETSPLNSKGLFGCADIYSTAYDICLFDQALMEGRLLHKNSLQLMQTPGLKSSDYGLGLYVKADQVFSRGVLKGFESFHVFYRDGTAITILLNVREHNSSIRQLSKGIYELVKAES